MMKQNHPVERCSDWEGGGDPREQKQCFLVNTQHWCAIWPVGTMGTVLGCPTTPEAEVPNGVQQMVTNSRGIGSRPSGHYWTRCEHAGFGGRQVVCKSRRVLFAVGAVRIVHSVTRDRMSGTVARQRA